MLNVYAQESRKNERNKGKEKEERKDDKKGGRWEGGKGETKKASKPSILEIPYEL